jgi:uridine kinase
MSGTNRLNSPELFTSALYEVMLGVQSGITDLDQNEFRYALENLTPRDGWVSLGLESQAIIESRITNRAFYESIQLKPRQGEKIVLDNNIENLTCMLLKGLVDGEYAQEWVKTRFYFDVRGFFFLPRTTYFTDEVLANFGGRPFKSFDKQQQIFERFQGIGYKDFRRANVEIDQAFIDSIKKVIALQEMPTLITLAGPTAAGKTEITERLLDEFNKLGRKVTTIETDNFLLDREFRDDKAIGKESTHFGIFIRSLEQILQGKKVVIPRYDFVNATSSHDRDGVLRPSCTPLEVEPADIVFVEGNFPFHIEEIARLIGIKVVYLTDDPIRLKRKWKRDIDYRKKYDPTYFRNRFFRTQFLRAEDIYRPLMQVCDMIVDTTNAALWATPQIAAILDSEGT